MKLKKRKPQQSSLHAVNETWLVVGLGNSGPGYIHNRHNIGYLVVEELASRQRATFKNHKARALIAQTRFGMGGPRVILGKPSVFMNLSGGPTAMLAKFFDISVDHLVTIHDEIDIPFDTIKLKLGGGEGGHNGLRSISQALATKDYLRVRVGVGRPPGRGDAASHVLRDFSSTENKTLPLLIDAAADAVELLVCEGLVSAQEKFPLTGH